MPNLAVSNDNLVYKYAADTWINVRSASSGFATTLATATLKNMSVSGRGGVVVQVGRFFMEFDTSGITSTLDSATLKIKAKASTQTLSTILLKSSQSGAVTSSDYNEISGASTPLAASDGSGAGTFASTAVVEYSGEIGTLNTSDAWEDITLNSTALSDIVANDTFNCVLVGYTYDYLDQSPSSATYDAVFYSQTSSGNEPYMSYELAATAATDNAIFFGTNF